MRQWGGGNSGCIWVAGDLQASSAASFRSLTANAKRGMLPLRLIPETGNINSDL